MTSINIQTVSNKSNFVNFYSQPITFPKNTQVAMTKANLNIPIFVAPQISPPDIGAHGNWTEIACRVEIDGITKNVTWNEIYNAHVDLAGCESFNGRDNWSASYKYLPCNQVLFLNNATGEVEVKTDFNTVLARTITNKYAFYQVFPSPSYVFGEASTQSINFTLGGDITQPVTGQALNGLDFTNNLQSELGFNVEYAPYKVFARNETFVNVNNNPKFNWIQGAALHGLRGAVGPCCCFMEQADFDFNGGWITTFPNVVTTNAAGLMAWGIGFVGQGTQANDEKIPIQTYDTKIIDIGIEFGYDAVNGRYHYNIITKAKEYNSSADARIVHSTFTPHVKVNGFDNNGDHFFIQILRGNDLQDTTGFVVNILQGANNNPHDDPNAVIVYTERININPQTQIVPIYLANTAAGTDAWEFNSNAFIAKTQDTVEQGDLNFVGNAYSVRQMSIEPNIEFPLAVNSFLLTQQSFDFWNAFGLFTKNTYGLGSTNNQKFIKYEGTEYVRTWKQKTNVGEATELFYYLGEQSLNRIWRFADPAVIGAGNAFLELNVDNAVRNLPQMLNVGINNIDIKNFNGTFPYGQSADGTQTIYDTKAGDSRVVGTIPLPIDQVGILSKNIEITYEPFNLLYRPINNPNAFTLNKLDVEVFYKDFYTNRKKNVDTLEGTANIEFHVRGGSNPQPPNKIGLRPV